MTHIMRPHLFRLHEICYRNFHEEFCKNRFLPTPSAARRARLWTNLKNGTVRKPFLSACPTIAVEQNTLVCSGVLALCTKGKFCKKADPAVYKGLKFSKVSLKLSRMKYTVRGLAYPS